MKNMLSAEGLSYDDVLIEPRYSDLRSRSEVKFNTRLTRNINLKIPLISANMDTVTEDKMAIEMAKQGGIGIIHRFCSVEKQVELISNVKKYSTFIIKEPVCISAETKICELEKYPFKSFIITDEEGILEGIITARDLERSKLYGMNEAKDILNTEIITTKNENISYSEAKKILIDNNIQKLPVINDKGKIKGLITLKNIKYYEYHVKHSSIDTESRLMVGAAIGVHDVEERGRALIEAGADVFVIDIAHGHSLLVKECIQKLKETMNNMKKNVDIIAGNVCTAEGVKFLIECGADAVKVGIGGGSICLTRVQTGCGVPQLSAVMECCAEAEKYDIPIIGDGAHCGKIGNIVKDLIFADTVMLGGFLAGSEETPGTFFLRNNRRVKIVRGMAGFGANLDQREMKNFTAEGTEATVPYKGKVTDIIKEILGGVKSGFSYMGVRSLDELHKERKHIRLRKVTQNGVRESGRHSNKEL